MKKFIITEAVLFALFISTMGINDNIGTIFGLCFFAWPICFFAYRFIKKHTQKPEPVHVVVEEPKPQWKYLWLLKDDQTTGNKFERWYKGSLVENEEYFRANKDLKDDYYNERIYQYEPFELPLKIEENKVFSYMKDNEWVLVGYIKENDREALKNALETKLCLMSNRYKRVGDNYVQKESGDAYFGLRILEPVPKN